MSTDQNQRPLYDGYGRPIHKIVPETTEPTQTAKVISTTRWRRLISWHKSLPKGWRYSLDILGLIGIVATMTQLVLLFRDELSVDPYVSYDSSDPFSQRFTITNNGAVSIYDAHYACAVTYLETTTRRGLAGLNLIQVMVPSEPHISVLRRKQKDSADCDFIARFGNDLVAVRVEIEVFYRSWMRPWPRHGPGWKFSARRDVGGRFIWDYGSPDKGLFDDETRPAVFMPFNGRCCPFDPQLLFRDMQEITKASAAHRTHKAIAMTMLPCGGPCRR